MIDNITECFNKYCVDKIQGGYDKIYDKILLPLKYNDIKLDNVISYDCSNISRLINIEITRIFNGQI